MADFFDDEDETLHCEVCNNPIPNPIMCSVCHNNVCDLHVAYEHMLIVGSQDPVCTECANVHK